MRIAYKELYQIIMKQMDEDIKTYNERIVEPPIENRNSYEKAKKSKKKQNICTEHNRT